MACKLEALFKFANWAWSIICRPGKPCEISQMPEERTIATTSGFVNTPVFTLGLAGDPAHMLQCSNIPLVNTDRGGQITYHGPGQIVVYPLLDLRHYGLKVREYVQLLEQSIIDALVQVGVADAQRKPNAPGVYTFHNGGLAKIAALGIKIRKGCAYHGLSLNVDMDLKPFQQINPCGYAGLETVDLVTIGVKISLPEMQVHLMKYLIQHLEAAQSALKA